MNPSPRPTFPEVVTPFLKTLALALALLAPAAARADDVPATGTVRGRVYSPFAPRYVVEKPILLTFATTDGIELGTTSTDDQGRFVLEGVPVGFHRLVAWRRSEGSRPLPEIAVRAGETVDELAVVLEPQAVVRVRVETPSRRPARVERVVIENAPHSVAAKRGKRDTWEVRVPKGPWRLVVHATGFRTYEEELELEDFDRVYRTVELKPGQSLLGTVVADDTGEAIADAEVERLPRLRPLVDGATWTTGSRGRFDLPGGASGLNWFRARAEGFEHLMVEIDLEDAFITRHTLRLKRLAGDGVVRGHVVDAGGRGLGGMTVVALPSVRRHPTRRAITDDSGAFRIERVEPGALTVTVEDPNDELNAAFATTRPNDGAVRLSVRRRPVVVVAAKRSNGAALGLWRARWRVQRSDDDIEEGTVSVTGAGVARIVLPRAGSVTIAIEAPGWPTPAPIEVDADWDTERTVEFEVPGPRANARVLGWIMRRDSIPLDVPFTLWIRHVDGRLERVETNELGGYRRRDLPSGEYALFVTRGTRRPDDSSRTAAGTLRSGKATRIDLPVDAALVVTRLEPHEDETLRVGDALIRVAGARMTHREELDEVIEYFKERRVRIELLRDGELQEVWVGPSTNLAEHSYEERLR